MEAGRLSEIMSAIAPIPRCDIAIRQGTLADVPFMDGLQKKYGKALGYFPTKQFEEYVESGGVLVAEETERVRVRVGVRVGEEAESDLTLRRYPKTVFRSLIRRYHSSAESS
jgi:hypothetical protein